MPPPLCVIVNPAAARRRAGGRLRRVRQLLSTCADFRTTCAPGHAEMLARNAAHAGYATVVAAGGDGTVHEVANGLLSAGPTSACFGVIPLGSGNDYAAGLGLPADVRRFCEQLVHGPARAVDVGAVRDAHGRSRYFVNTLGTGLSGAVCYEARRISGLSGLALYGLAALRAICRHFTASDTVLTIDGADRATPTVFLAVALGPREGGGFVVAPDARLDDGWFDYLHAGRLTRWRALWYLPRLAAGRLPANDPAVSYGRCRRVSVRSAAPLIVHTDGELFARPEDKVRSLDIELLPGRLSVRGSGPG
jgi:YegS/Rv2252/BmrU family lipid kinase